MGNNNNGLGPGTVLIEQNGMTMKIPPHLVAVLTESSVGSNMGRTAYEVMSATGMNGPNGVLVNSYTNNGGMSLGGGNFYPSSRSSGSSYGEGGTSSSSSVRNNPGGNSAESSSFDSGIGPHSITSE